MAICIEGGGGGAFGFCIMRNENPLAEWLVINYLPDGLTSFGTLYLLISTSSQLTRMIPDDHQIPYSHMSKENLLFLQDLQFP